MSNPAQVIGIEAVEPSRRRNERAGRRGGGWRGIVTSWRTPATRSLALGVLWLLGWLLWQGQRLALIGYLGVAVSQTVRNELAGGSWDWVRVTEAPGSLALGLGCVVCGHQEGWVNVEQQGGGVPG